MRSSSLGIPSEGPRCSPVTVPSAQMVFRRAQLGRGRDFPGGIAAALEGQVLWIENYPDVVSSLCGIAQMESFPVNLPRRQGVGMSDTAADFCSTPRSRERVREPANVSLKCTGLEQFCGSACHTWPHWHTSHTSRCTLHSLYEWHWITFCLR